MREFTISDRDQVITLIYRELKAFDVYLMAQEILTFCFGEGIDINQGNLPQTNTVYNYLKNMLSYLGSRDAQFTKKFYDRLFQGHFVLIDDVETPLNVELLNIILKNNANFITIAIECGKNHFNDFFTTLLGINIDEIR